MIRTIWMIRLQSGPFKGAVAAALVLGRWSGFGVRLGKEGSAHGTGLPGERWMGARSGACPPAAAGIGFSTRGSASPRALRNADSVRKKPEKPAASALRIRSGTAPRAPAPCSTSSGSVTFSSSGVSFPRGVAIGVESFIESAG